MNSLKQSKASYCVMLLIYSAVLLWSTWRPLAGYFIWSLEVFPALLGLLLLLLSFKQFRFSNFAYWWLLVHAIILMVGGHYTYAEVPLFDWLKDLLDLSRNHYDKVGHFAQGFVPAIVAREILLRRNIVVQTGYWLEFLTLCICLAISALYEIFEWWVALLSGSEADAFLGTQGYVWDTQSDMLFCLVGAAMMLLLFSRQHDRSIAKVPVS